MTYTDDTATIKARLRKYIEDAPIGKVLALRLDLQGLAAECEEREARDMENEYNNGEERYEKD